MKFATTTIVRALLIVAALGLLGACYGSACCWNDGCGTACEWNVWTGWWGYYPCYGYGDCYWSTLEPDALAPAPEEVW